jgi:hypothetical protein
VASISLIEQARDIERRLNSILSSFDIDSLPSAQREITALIKRQATDVRLDVRDYEYADTRSEQIALQGQARKRLENLQHHIVKASEYNLFGAIDVAALSASIQQLVSKVE